MILLGLWVAFLGYDVLYTGVQKLAGDTSCTMGKALRGKCSAQLAGHGGPVAGLTRSDQAAQARAQQYGLIGRVPLQAAA